MKRRGKLRIKPWCNLKITLEEMRRNQQKRVSKGNQSVREEKETRNVYPGNQVKEIFFKEKEVINLSHAADKSLKMKTENWI